ncbi:MAG: serine/threonine-protein phosphatase, partial [Vallitaleaceae bacterium]|nr:serine/threonine-protein phosphatase [Vallitaleaceae bacterium]
FEEAIRNSNLFGMGTTIDVVTINDKGRVFMGHVGDGRVYVQENGYLRQLTKDHSYVQELMDSGTITKEEALVHPNRNQITRALGMDKRIDIDLFYYDIYEQSEYLLICSDGLSNMVDNETISDILKNQMSVADKVKLLEQEAMNHGGRDNISLILIELEKAV